MKNLEGEVRKVLQKAEERVQRTSFPLYDLDDRKHPLVGSSVLLSTGIGLFLLTACHVLERHLPTRPLYLPVGNDFIPIEGSSSRNSEYDFAFIRLKSHICERLNGENAHFINPSDIDIDDVAWPHSLYGFAGYPETKNRPVEPFTLKRSSSVFVITPARGKRYEELGFTQSTHFMGDFRIRELVVKGVNGTVTGPDPYGMSGGSVWRMARLRDLSLGVTTEKLVGLSIEYRRREQVLIGVRFSVIVSALRTEHPELAKELNEPRRIRVRISRESTKDGRE